MIKFSEKTLSAWFATLALVLYGVSVHFLDGIPRPKEQDVLSVAVPPPMQVVLAGGDRYLAANIAVFRAMMVAGYVEHDEATYRVLAQVQADAAILNPAHEDNYYIAQAVLPWVGQVELNQSIQKMATEARPRDMLPPFFLGFNRFYFLRDPVGGAEAVKEAARRADPVNRGALMAIAAKWYEKGDDPELAITMIRGLMKSTRDQRLQQHLQRRVERLKGLIALRNAATRYRAARGKPPSRLEELVSGGYIEAIPQDPFGLGYTLSPQGEPMLVLTKGQRIVIR
jgi:hypothetical protein